MRKDLTVTGRQVERSTDAGLDREAGQAEAAGLATVGSLAGLLARDRAPDYEECRAVRTLLSASLLGRAGPDGVRDHED